MVADSRTGVVDPWSASPASTGHSPDPTLPIPGATMTRPIPLLPPAQVADRTEAVLLDVREDDEVAGGRIAGSTHIPLGQLSDRLAELDPSRPVITVCRSGGRSARAALFLAAQGYDVADLDGGMTRWADEHRPTV